MLDDEYNVRLVFDDESVRSVNLRVERRLRAITVPRVALIDVSVVEGAIRRRHAVVTSDSAHLKKVAGAAGVKLEIHAV